MKENMIFSVMFIIYFLTPTIILPLKYMIQMKTIIALISCFVIYTCSFFLYSDLSIFGGLIIYVAFIISFYFSTKDMMVPLFYLLVVNIILNISWYFSFGILLGMKGQNSMTFPFGTLSNVEIVTGYVLQFIFIVIQSAIMKNYLNYNSMDSLKGLFKNSLLVKILMVGVPICIETATVAIFLIPEIDYRYSMITMLVMIFIVIYFLGTISLKMKVRQQDELLEVISKQQENLESRNRYLNGLKHDFKNVLISVNLFIQKDDYAGLTHYLKDVDIMMIDTDGETMELPEIKNLAIKGLLWAKMLHAKSEGIKINIKVLEIIDGLSVNITKCIRVLGIILDNAIEGTSESEEKSIDILIYRQQGSIVFLVLNTIGDVCEIDMKALYHPGYSSKGPNRGYGLYNVAMIVRDEQQMTFHPKIEGNSFIAKFIVDENNKESKKYEKSICD
ncbi:GHKL domain-containing protein [Listeria grandensis]|uniref:GHKL domain-containing protein n=1 Tax=Listeria grandensis TaxID=1494963 RepID=A0A7X1CPW3_9LIST|nr:GHKL domain-containing protein [Listeria grandensis]MBC1474001.1 GHKL domain-containing protein [Listeria grandensis]MBC1936397.1 GHKL domain-containing protein [Listeria grandensis]